MSTPPLNHVSVVSVVRLGNANSIGVSSLVHGFSSFVLRPIKKFFMRPRQARN